jgi:hypothetical protein
MDARSDLSVLFVLLGLTMLQPLGSLCFVLPAAIFDARYQSVISSALRATGRSAMFLESATSRSFPSAAVNTGIFVAGPAKIFGSGDGSIRRVTVQTSLLELRLSSVFNFAGSRVDRSGHAGDADVLTRLAEGRLALLSSLGQVRYSIKTGLNKFFYPSPSLVERFAIEEEFLLPVAKSPREISKIALEAEHCSARLFSCRDPEEELARAGKPGALAYIRWGGRRLTAEGIPWPLLPSLRDRVLWYAVPHSRSGDLLCPRFFDRRYLFVAPGPGIVADQTFYWLHLNEPETKELAAATLNSSFTHLSLETHGRSGLGDGVRQYALCDTARLPILDCRRLDERFTCSILDAYRSVAARELLPAHEEYGQPDRVELDASVARALALPPGAPKRARAAVLRSLEQRMERARSVRAV